MLLFTWDALLVLDFSFVVVSGVTELDLRCDGLAVRVFMKICISAFAGKLLSGLVKENKLKKFFLSDNILRGLTLLLLFFQQQS